MPYLAWAWMLRFAVSEGPNVAPVPEPWRHTAAPGARAGHEHIFVARPCRRATRWATLKKCNGHGTVQGLRDQRGREAKREEPPIPAWLVAGACQGFGDSHAANPHGPVRTPFGSA